MLVRDRNTVATVKLRFPDCNLPVLGSVLLSVSDIMEKKADEGTGDDHGSSQEQRQRASKKQSAPRPEKHQHGQPGQEKARTQGSNTFHL